MEKYTESWMEVSSINSLGGFIGTTSHNTNHEVTRDDITRFLLNPYAHLKQIRNASVYLTGKHGILRDVLRMVKSLATLKYSLQWSNYEDRERNKENEELVQEFLDRINMTEFIRDGLYEVAELGTVVTCLRSKSYVQFLDVDSLSINKQRNGKWVVEYDLASLDNISGMQSKINEINSLPPEVTLAKYNDYRNSKDNAKRFIEISNCHVVKMDGKRNSPYGFPMTMGAWLSLAQKDIINEVERSVADRLIKQIVVLSAGHLDKEQKRPVPKELLSAYFKEITSMLEKQDQNSSKAKKSGGIGTIALPDFLSIDSLRVDTTMFEKELYDKINDDIFLDLGVSPALIAGLGGSYASAGINNEKFFSVVIVLLEQFERIINDYIKMIIPKTEKCEIVFDRTTVLDKNAEIENKKEFYMQTSVIQPWIDALFGGGSFPSVVSQAEYEKDVIGTDKLFHPAKNAYTTSGKDSDGTKEDSEIDNENTMKTRQDDGNSTPSPSD